MQVGNISEAVLLLSNSLDVNIDTDSENTVPVSPEKIEELNE